MCYEIISFVFLFINFFLTDQSVPLGKSLKNNRSTQMNVLEKLSKKKLNHKHYTCVLLLKLCVKVNFQQIYW